jgi:hypothetical protein
MLQHLSFKAELTFFNLIEHQVLDTNAGKTGAEKQLS